MAINKNSNVYTIIYTVVMVVIVASLLAFLSTTLKEKQDANVLNDQKFAILKAFGLADDNSNKDEAVEEYFSNVTVSIVNGEEVVEVKQSDKMYGDAFKLLSKRTDLNQAMKTKNNLPIFKYVKSETETLYVLPLVGKGLWNDIWGYIALQPKDGNLEIVGIVMDHAGETPGLGAEIATSGVQKKFHGKKLYDDNKNVAVKMVKGGAKNFDHEVDAISGGTKTCDGVNAMLETSLGAYASFLSTIATGAEQATGVECGECCDHKADCEKCAECPERETCEKQCDKATCEQCADCDKKAECEKQCCDSCDKHQTEENGETK